MPTDYLQEVTIKFFTIGSGFLKATVRENILQRSYYNSTKLTLANNFVVACLFYPLDSRSLDYSNLTGLVPIQYLNQIVSDFRFYDTPFRLNVLFC